MDAIQTRDELEFAIFCIENTAIELGVSAVQVYDAWTRKSDLLERYVVYCYEPLHTQGKDYIVEDLLRVMKERGIEI